MMKTYLKRAFQLSDSGVKGLAKSIWSFFLYYVSFVPPMICVFLFADRLLNGNTGKPVVYLLFKVLWQIIGTDLYCLDHLCGDLVTFLDVLRHTDDLRFLTGATAEQRRNTEADDQRQQDTQHTDDGAIAKNLQIVFLLIENMRE